MAQRRDEAAILVKSVFSRHGVLRALHGALRSFAPRRSADLKRRRRVRDFFEINAVIHLKNTWADPFAGSLGASYAPFR
jgi:hypothetical protein